MWYTASERNDAHRMIMQCPYCGSSRVETGITWGLSVNTGDVGLRYNDGYMGEGIAQTYSDLCLDCKTILRTYIKEDTDKNWVHRSDDASEA